MTRLTLLIEPEVHHARKYLPGNVRQRVKRAIESLAEEPRFPDSRSLDATGLDVPPHVELRRLQIDRWRIVYAVNDEEHWVWVLAIRRRPPYNYEDLEELIGGLE